MLRVRMPNQATAAFNQIYSPIAKVAGAILFCRLRIGKLRQGGSLGSPPIKSLSCSVRLCTKKAAMNQPYSARPGLALLAGGARQQWPLLARRAVPTFCFTQFLAAGVAASAFLSISLPSAAHSCEQWSVQGAGNQILVQSNGFAPVFSLAQAGSEFTGSALYSPESPGGSVSGKVNGRITGSSFQLSVDWKDRKTGAYTTTGVYTGTISNDGQIEGKTYDPGHPNFQASWYSTTLLRCLTRAEADFCIDYASKAVAATKESNKLGCEGDGPPRWSVNLRDQIDWCRWHQELANSETAARAGVVESCRQRIAQPAQMEFCQKYAKAAMAASREWEGLRCGDAGSLWSTHVNDHLSWCLGLNGDQGEPNAKTAARENALGPCRERVAQERQLEPQAPIGDTIKPVDPQDKAGVFEKPGTGLGQFLHQKP